jgi:MFS family permease
MGDYEERVGLLGGKARDRTAGADTPVANTRLGFFTATCRVDPHVLSVFLLSVSFLFAFAPFSAIQNLESSLNPQDKLGSTALATLYLVFTAGCFLAPAVVGSFGPKYTMVISSIFVCFFVMAHVKPSWFTLMPASASVGLWCAFMWTAQGVYITECAVGYAASKRGMDLSTALNTFNGIFWGLYQSNQIMGNIVSSIVLRNGHSQETLLTLFIIFFSLAAIATVLLCLLPNLSELAAASEQDERHSSSKPRSKKANDVEKKIKTLEEMVWSIFSLMKDPRMVLLAPMFFHIGISFGFLCSDFSKHLVLESLGIAHIGLVMCAFGGVDAIACLTVGKLVPLVGRGNVLLAAYGMYSVSFIFMMVWEVETNAYFYLYSVAMLYGVADGLFVTQIYAIIGERFQDSAEVAFALFRLWSGLGTSVAFFGSSAFAWHVKLWFLLILVNASLLGYLLLEKSNGIKDLFASFFAHSG